MPADVGQIRAMRECYSQRAINLSQIRPRYNEFNWQYEWRDWRLKGLFALQTSVHNQSLLTCTVKAIEDPPVQVTITGPAEGSANISETLVMDSLSKTTTNAFNNVLSFIKNRVNTYDIILTDVDETQLSVLPNNKLEASYQIIDISTCPWLPTQGNPLFNYIEVLFKKALPWFQNDSDEFPAVGYDNIIVNKCLQLWNEEQGNVQLAVSYYQKAIQSMAQIREDVNRGTDDVVALVHNPHDYLMPRVGFGRDWQWCYRIQGR